jgi:hypothetical protein
MEGVRMSQSLSAIEKTSLKTLEKVIESGVASFLATGSALKEIRDDRLYRENHKTFESYIKSRWGFEKSRAYQLIAASDIKDNLSTVVDVPKAKEINNERQLRELTNVPAESLKDVIVKASEIVGDEPLTAKAIKQAREEVLETKPEPVKEEFVDVEDEPESATKDDPFFDAKDRSAAINSLSKLGDKWRREIKDLCNDDGCEYLAFEFQEIDDLIKRVQFKMRQSTFAHVCFDCNGKGKKCGKCKQLGWLCKGSLQHLDQRQKDLLGVA